MSLRGITAQFVSNIWGTHVTVLTLIELRFDSGWLYLTDCPHDVTWNGITWQSAYGVMSVTDIKETAAEAAGIQFTLSGVPDSLLATALNEEMQGRPCMLRVATLDPALTLSVDDNAWRGTLDVPSVLRSEDGTCSITVTAEHMLARWDQPQQLLHSHEDQQRLAPGDMFYQYAARLASATIVWPAKEFFQK